MSAKIGKWTIKTLARRGMPGDLIEWLREKPRTVAELREYAPVRALEVAMCLGNIPDDIRDELHALGFGRVWTNSRGRLHRDGDLPARICPTGRREWHVRGLKHRKRPLPAVIDFDGAEEFWFWGVREKDPTC